MGQFTRDAVPRIARATFEVERRLRNAPSHHVPWSGLDGDMLVHCRLTSHLDAGGTASAVTLVWDESANSGDGDYATVETVTVRDTLGQFWGLIGEQLVCRPIHSDNGVVWEVLSHGAPYHVGAISGTALNQGSYVAVDVYVKGIQRGVTAYDEYLESGGSLIQGTKIGIIYDVEEARWLTVNTPCS